MIVTDVNDSFFVPMKMTMFVAVVTALPIVLSQICALVAPGLHQHEKKLVAPLVGSSHAVSVRHGACILRRVSDHLSLNGARQRSAGREGEHRYRQFAMTKFIAFGATFKVPILGMALVPIGTPTAKKLREISPSAIIGAFLIFALVTLPECFRK
jgi:sec-independent protein translocase protein TatC